MQMLESSWDLPKYKNKKLPTTVPVGKLTVVMGDRKMALPSGSSLKLTFINLRNRLTQEFHLSLVNVLLNLIFNGTFGTLDRISGTKTCLVLAIL
jgi:hypothetical protein